MKTAQELHAEREQAKKIKEVMTMLSKRGHESMTPEARSARASKASLARWHKDKPTD